MKNKTLKGLLLIGIGIGVGIGVYVNKKNKCKKHSIKDIKKEKIVDKNKPNDVINIKENNILDFETLLENKEKNDTKFSNKRNNNEKDELIKEEFSKNCNIEEIKDNKTLEFNDENIKDFDIAKTNNDSKYNDEDVEETDLVEKNELEDVAIQDCFDEEYNVENCLIKETLNDISLIKNDTLEIETKKDDEFVIDETINENNVIEDEYSKNVDNNLAKETLNNMNSTIVAKGNFDKKGKQIELECIDNFNNQEKDDLPNIGLLDYYMICKELWVNDYKPSDLMVILESLYDKGFVTNPKSECRYVSSNTANDFDIVLENLYSIEELKQYIEQITTNDIEKVMNDKNYVDDFWVRDRRNEAIVPTLKVPNLETLSKEEKEVFLFIAKCFISIFLDSKTPEECKKNEINKIRGDECFITKEDIDEIEDELSDNNMSSLENKEENDEKATIEQELESIKERKKILENNKKQGFLSSRDFMELSNELLSRENELIEKINKM